MQKPYVIGICGGSGSGKTTLVDMALKSFTNEQVSLLTQDDFYIPREEQTTDKNGVVNFDRLNSIDHNYFQESLQKLIEGQSISIKEYVFNNEEAIAQVKEISPAPVLIVEGLFIFQNQEIKNLLDLQVFIDTRDAVKVIRRIQRDQKERNYPVSDVLYRYEHHVLPSYRKYIEPYKEEADLIINNNKDIKLGVAVLSNLIKAALD